MSIKQSAKLMNRFTKTDNRIQENFIRKYPDYKVWSEKCFEHNKELLKTIIGRF